MVDAHISCSGSEQEFSQAGEVLGHGMTHGISDREAQGLLDAAPSPSWEPLTALQDSPGPAQAGALLAGLPETSEHPFPAGFCSQKPLLLSTGSPGRSRRTH